MCFFECCGDHRDLHGIAHAYPTRRSSDHAQQAEADVSAQQAMLRSAQIDLARTTIRAPISGRIGRSTYTIGALVSASQTDPLTTIQRLDRSEEHTSEFQSLMRSSYAAFCLKTKKQFTDQHRTNKSI